MNNCDQLVVDTESSLTLERHLFDCNGCGAGLTALVFFKLNSRGISLSRKKCLDFSGAGIQNDEKNGT